MSIARALSCTMWVAMLALGVWGCSRLGRIPAEAQAQPKLASLVILTEDMAHIGDGIDGCDAISLHDVESGAVLGRGIERRSGARWGQP